MPIQHQPTPRERVGDVGLHEPRAARRALPAQQGPPNEAKASVLTASKAAASSTVPTARCHSAVGCRPFVTQRESDPTADSGAVTRPR
jgi:hypothetical protein